MPNDLFQRPSGTRSVMRTTEARTDSGRHADPCLNLRLCWRCGSCGSLQVLEHLHPRFSSTRMRSLSITLMFGIPPCSDVPGPEVHEAHSEPWIDQHVYSGAHHFPRISFHGKSRVSPLVLRGYVRAPAHLQRTCSILLPSIMFTY